MLRKSIYIASLAICGIGFSQQKPIDTVYVSDIRLSRLDNLQKNIYVTDNKTKNTTNLSEILRFQTPIHIKENGRGMVSSPSFRGTTAQHTAFLWNGININSVFLGQGDINNIGILSTDQITVKPGGNSIMYGTGAIGGSIHLNDLVSFDDGFSGNLFSEFGSYQTYNATLKLQYSTKKSFVKFSTAILSSVNDYEVPQKRYINRNGMYHLHNHSFVAAYRINDIHNIAFYNLWNDGLQHFPIFSASQTKTKYETQGFKAMLNLESRFGQITNNLKTAFLQEGYDYFENISKPKSNGAVADTWLVRNDLSYRNTLIDVDFLSELQHNKANGYNSGIINPSRNVGYTALQLKKQISPTFYLEGAVRKDFVEDIDSPILYSVGSKLQLSKSYSLKLKGSKNFRYPTFNDLYWQPGGNLDLLPETSYQLEMSNVFQNKTWELELVPYYNRIMNLIQWLPTSEGYWSPFNTREVASYGFELYTQYQVPIRNADLLLRMMYTYTHSENMETKRMLSYVPEHKAVINVSYNHKLVKPYVQYMFTGLVYTSTDENMQTALSEYNIVNLGTDIQLFKNLNLGLKINNLFNQVYQTSNYYPLPLRNYAININFII
ncbi:MAG: TonB-dependent receptor [Bacteroidota bacterium]|nr:TonB-dependent receptor [Bacteroidota bacterium]